MRRRPCRWRLAVALGLAGCGTGWRTANAQAVVLDGPLDDGLVYEKQLDLGLDSVPVGEAEPRTRVVQGSASAPGEWPTVVSLDVFKNGGRGGSLCAGTVIAPRWILTAAHCVFGKRHGGVKGLRSITAFAKSNLPRAGEARRVRSVIVHRKFAAVPRAGKGAGLINDIALLELEAATTAPRQKLAAQAGRATFLAPGTTMTVVGWGATRPRRPNQAHDAALRSKVLLRANVPVAERRACEAFLGFPATPARPVFCAGDGRGGADSCNGDSGGPIFVAGRDGKPVQVGVVSWGDGCALPGTYGAYAAIPDFERWIRKHVPKAQWAMPAEPFPATVAGPLPAGALRPVRLRIVGLAAAERHRIASSLPNATLVGEAEAASLIWDARRHLVLDHRGHRVAEAVDADTLRHAVDRRSALDRLIPMSAVSGLEVGLRLLGEAAGAPDAAARRAHGPGTRFAIRISGVANGSYYAVFNLTGNGKVQMLMPTPYLRMADYPDRPAFATPAFRTGARSGSGSLVVTGGWVPRDGPFGAEHVVAVAGMRPLSRFMSALAKAHGKFGVVSVMAALGQEAQAQPLQVGFRGLYTSGFRFQGSGFRSVPTAP